jgi:hypothetical protein
VVTTPGKEGPSLNEKERIACCGRELNFISMKTRKGTGVLEFTTLYAKRV